VGIPARARLMNAFFTATLDDRLIAGAGIVVETRSSWWTLSSCA